MMKYYSEPELEIRAYRITDVFTDSTGAGGYKDDDEFELDGANGSRANNWFDD